MNSSPQWSKSKLSGKVIVASMMPSRALVSRSSFIALTVPDGDGDGDGGSKRAFLGWLRGERDHCKMVAIPTAKDEDAKRPNRERESLVGEQNRIINRMKAALIRLGIRGFIPS